jgi:S-adenosylmethionine decarboxylase
MQGLHLTADLHGCAPDASAHGDLMRDAQALRRLCVAAVRACGFTAVGELFHRFAEPGGVTGVVLLAESHLAVHTWPERGEVTIDVYACNVSGDKRGAARALMQALVDAFAAARTTSQAIERGLPSDALDGARP